MELIIDTREPPEMERKFNQWIKCRSEKLEVGDYKYGDLVIERKTIFDFISSIKKGHIQKQAIELQQFKYPYVIVIGYYEDIFKSPQYQYFRHFTKEHWIGSLASINIRYERVKFINIRNNKDYIKLVLKLIEKTYDNKKVLYSTEVMKLDKNVSLEDRKALMLTAIPGVSLGKAKTLLKKIDIKFIHKKRGDEVKRYDVLMCDGFGDKTTDNVMKVIK